MITLALMTMNCQAPTNDFYIAPYAVDDIHEFYLEPRIHYDGHLWRPLMMQHHPECECQDTLTEL